MVNEITPFKPYFDAYGGGVTVSGGEPLLQIKILNHPILVIKRTRYSYLYRYISWYSK